VVTKVAEHIKQGGPLTASAIEPSPLLKSGRSKSPGAKLSADELVESRPGGGRVEPTAPTVSTAPAKVGEASAPSSAVSANANIGSQVLVAEVLPGQLPALCPECSTPVQHEGGCVICRNCGYSKCG
jgi:hypothetical protein